MTAGTTKAQAREASRARVVRMADFRSDDFLDGIDTRIEVLRLLVAQLRVLRSRGGECVSAGADATFGGLATAVRTAVDETVADLDLERLVRDGAAADQAEDAVLATYDRTRR